MVLEFYNLFEKGTQGYHFLLCNPNTQQVLEWRRFIGGDRYENSLAYIGAIGESSEIELPRGPQRKTVLEGISSKDFDEFLESIKGRNEIRANKISSFLRKNRNN